MGSARWRWIHCAELRAGADRPQAVNAVLTVATAVLVLTTLLPLWRNPSWWVRVWDFPRLQLAAVAALLAVATVTTLGTHEPLGIALLAGQLACLLYQGWWILPYTPFYRREVKAVARGDGNRLLRLLVSNVLTPNRQADRLLALVRQHEPDLVLAVETDGWWESRLDTLEPEYPYSLKCPLDNLYGMHLYSRLPLQDARIQFLVEDDIPSIHALAVLRGGESVRLHCLHPAPPSPTENDESSERDAELIAVGKSVAESEGPVVVMGDLNDVAWSETTRLFRKISGLLDPRVGRGMFNTFHARWPILRWPLDHLFHSDDLAPVRIERLPSIGSDHFPLLAELRLVSEPALEGEALEADEEDREWAEEKMDEEGADEDAVHVPGENGDTRPPREAGLPHDMQPP